MNTSDVAKVLPPSQAEGNPLKIDGELAHDGAPVSGAIPFSGENIDLFLRLLERRLVQRGEGPNNSFRGGT